MMGACLLQWSSSSESPRLPAPCERQTACPSDFEVGNGGIVRGNVFVVLIWDDILTAETWPRKAGSSSICSLIFTPCFACNSVGASCSRSYYESSARRSTFHALFAIAKSSSTADFSRSLEAREKASMTASSLLPGKIALLLWSVIMFSCSGNVCDARLASRTIQICSCRKRGHRSSRRRGTSHEGSPSGSSLRGRSCDIRLARSSSSTPVAVHTTSKHLPSV